MPNKTIYVRDADLPLWDRAQKELGESVSSAIADFLRERLERERLAVKAKRPKKGKIDMAQAMDAVLAEINAVLELDIERHPSYSPIILDASSENIGYKLHQKRANPDRILSLVVGPQDFEMNGQLATAARDRISVEIENFWDGKCTVRHAFVKATAKV